MTRFYLVSAVIMFITPNKINTVVIQSCSNTGHSERSKKQPQRGASATE